jgi:two-component system LytT family sensor kinase
MFLSSDQIIFKIPKQLKFHVIFWAALITYEIPLAGFLSGRWGHLWDYTLHYIFYILLFYFHAEIALRKFKKGLFINFSLVLMELILSYMINLLIYILLMTSGVTTIIKTPSSILFILASTYRFSFILLLSTSYWYMNSRIKKLRIINLQKEEIHQKTLDFEELKAINLSEQLGRLKAIINPHFLLNTLHILYHQLRKKSSQEANHILNLAEMMKYNLCPTNQEHKIYLYQELDYIKSYLALRNLEKQYALDVRFNYIESEIEDELIIPMLLPTLVENIFQHGDLNNKNQPAKLNIKIHDHKLRIYISNKIRQAVVHQSNGIGVDNLVKRLSFFYPNAFSYKCYSYRSRYYQKLYLNIYL